MNDRYQELAVAVDRTFARELKELLDGQLLDRAVATDSPAVGNRTSPTRRTEEVTVVLQPRKDPSGRRARIVLIAAAVIAVAAAGVVFIAQHDDSPTLRPTVDTGAATTIAPPTTLPTATTTLATTTVAPATQAGLSDRQFAAAVALTTDDWGDGWYVDLDSPRWRMSREFAATLPACEPFLDTVFESSARPAAITTAMVTAIHTQGWEYVAVFPDVADAEAMMTALHDPGYAECNVAYYNQFQYWFGALAPNNFTVAPPDTVDVHADDSATFSITGDRLSSNHAAIPFVRQGRTVLMIDTTLMGSDRVDKVAALTARAVERVDAAERGTPFDPQEFTEEFIAGRMLPTVLDFGGSWSVVPNQSGWQFVSNLARSVPSCGSFISSVFERMSGSPLAHETLAIDPADVSSGGGVARLSIALFPEPSDARQVLQAVANPAFAVCAADYARAEPATQSWTATTRSPVTSPSIELDAGDDSLVIAFDGSYTWLGGTTSPSERIVTAFLRIDRALVVLDVTSDFMGDTKLRALVDRLVERSEAALAGAPIPR